MHNIDTKKYESLLSCSEAKKRAIALVVLWHCRIRNDEIDDKIIHILKADNALPLRRIAAKMISERCESKFKKVLIESLDDDDWSVRGEAIIGLKKLDPKILEEPNVASVMAEEEHPYCIICAQS